MLSGSHPDGVSGYWLRLYRPQFDFENVRGVGLDILSDRAPGQPESDGKKDHNPKRPAWEKSSNYIKETNQQPWQAYSQTTSSAPCAGPTRRTPTWKSTPMSASG